MKCLHLYAHQPPLPHVVFPCGMLPFPRYSFLYLGTQEPAKYTDLFHEHLLNTFYVSDTVLESGDRVVNKQVQVTSLMELE